MGWLPDSVELTLVFVLVLVAGVALVDWWAVATRRGRFENFAKPLVMVVLLGLAVTIDANPTSARVWFVAALAAGLVGDVLLLPAVDRFLAGLVAFGVGHILYLVGLAQIDRDQTMLLVGIVGGIALLAALGRPIVKAVWSTPMAVPVSLYMAIIASMVALAVGTGRWLIGVGGIAFALSDALLGSDRFVTSRPETRVWVHILYHLGQTCLILGLDLGAPLTTG